MQTTKAGEEAGISKEITDLGIQALHEKSGRGKEWTENVMATAARKMKWQKVGNAFAKAGSVFLTATIGILDAAKNYEPDDAPQEPKERPEKEND